MSLTSSQTDRPRVVIISVGELFGGVERHIVTLCRSLPYQPVAVVLFNEGLLAERLRQSSVNVVVLNRIRPYDRNAIAALRKLLADLQINVAHVHGYVATVYLYLAMKGLSIGVIKTEHGLPEFHGIFSYPSWKALLYRAAETYAARKMRATIVYVSRDIEERIKRRFRGLRSHFVPNGVELPGGARKRPREYPDDVRVIACVGRLEHVKGFDLAIDAVHELANEVNDLRLVIIGDGSLKAALLEQIAELGLSDHVSLSGFRDDIASYLAHADVVLMPSRHEGLPFVLLESMALGTPVVAANTGGLAETLTDGESGLLFPVGDVRELARALGAMLGNSGLRRRIAETARQFVVDNYAAAAMTGRYADLYTLCRDESSAFKRR